MTTVDMVLRLIDQAFNRKAWHGPNLRGSIRRVDARMAAWRSDANRRCIWEIVVHAAYWKYAVRRRLLGEKRGSFALKGSNWFPVPATASENAWHDAVLLLDECHLSMRQAIAGLRPEKLLEKSAGSKYRNIDMIHGIAAHDVYHAGQIQVLKRLAAGARK